MQKADPRWIVFAGLPFVLCCLLFALFYGIGSSGCFPYGKLASVVYMISRNSLLRVSRREMFNAEIWSSEGGKVPGRKPWEVCALFLQCGLAVQIFACVALTTGLPFGSAAVSSLLTSSRTASSST
jgi:hypothetical protein